jgi:hypothetical protein
VGGKTDTIHQPSFRSRVIAVLSGLFLAGPVFAGGLGLALPGGYGLKIYRVDYSEQRQALERTKHR